MTARRWDGSSWTGPAWQSACGLGVDTAADNRASVAAVTVCLDELQGRNHAWDVYAVATSQEEETFGGALTSPFQIRPDLAIVIDDFGRQRVDPKMLLNRWIIPLESPLPAQMMSGVASNVWAANIRPVRAKPVRSVAAEAADRVVAAHGGADEAEQRQQRRGRDDVAGNDAGGRRRHPAEGDFAPRVLAAMPRTGGMPLWSPDFAGMTHDRRGRLYYRKFTISSAPVSAWQCRSDSPNPTLPASPGRSPKPDPLRRRWRCAPRRTGAR